MTSVQLDIDMLFYYRHCGVRDPSWSELYHFVMFLNTQLIDFEQTNFCSKAAEEYLPGFRIFLLRFLITMSRVSVIMEFTSMRDFEKEI